MANFLQNDTDPRIDIIWAKNKWQSHLKRCKADVYSEATFHKRLLSRLIKDADEGVSCTKPVHLSREETMKYLAVNHLSALS